jgi:hypothetical protein
MVSANRSRLKILKASSIYGGLLSFTLVCTYIFLVVGFPGTFRYLPIQAFLLIFGVISVTVFSYLHLSYFEKASDEVVCPLSIGLIIISMCLIPSIIIVFFEILNIQVLFHGGRVPPPLLIPYILGDIGIIFSALSISAVMKSKRTVPSGLEMWKVKGLQFGVAILIIGVIIAGVSVSLGTVGNTKITYEVRLGASEETTFFLPVPIDNSSGKVADVMNDLKMVNGSCDWDIVDTLYGKALKVHTDMNCILSAEMGCGYKSWEEGNEWFYSYNVSMVKEINQTEQIYEVWVFASNENTTVRIRIVMDNGINNDLGYSAYEIPLKEGWQTIRLERHLMCYD